MIKNVTIKLDQVVKVIIKILTNLNVSIRTRFQHAIFLWKWIKFILFHCSQLARDGNSSFHLVVVSARYWKILLCT